ncbi:MAG: hypothetical protein ACRD3V_24570 [Vicinamibacteria bacterium]
MLRPFSPSIALLGLVLAGAPASAQERFLHFGPKAAAMGGAYTAVANDTTAFYWNPAGYSFGPALQAGFQWGESNMNRGDGATFADEASGVALGFTFMGAAGTFSRSSTSRREEDLLVSKGLRTFDLSVSILQSLPIDDLVIAANVHYLRGESHELFELFSSLPLEDRDPSSIHDRVFDSPGETSSTASLDLAALYAPNEWLRLGLMFRRLFEPKFRTLAGGEIVLPRHARAGVAFQLPRQALLSLDVDLSAQGGGEEDWRELSVGGEKRFCGDAISLRAGLRAETGSGRGARPAFSVGAAGRVRFVLVEVAYVVSSDDRDDALWFAATIAP